MLIEAQIAYLRAFRADLQSELQSGTRSSGFSHAVAAMQARYPDYKPVAQIEDLLNQDADALATEIGAELRQ